MADIVLEKVNETFMKVHCDESLSREIWETFSFTDETAQFKPNYNPGKGWDGTLRLFNLRTRTMPIGLLRKLVEWANHNDYKVQIPDWVFGNEWSLTDTKKFIEGLGLPEGIDTDRDYQLAGFTHAIRNKRCVLEAATSSGKSFIIYLIVNWILSSSGKNKGVIIVPSIGLVEQLYKDFRLFGMPVEKLIHRIYAETGEGVHTDKPITISTWQSLQDQPKDFFHQFEFVIGDEAHHFKAKKLKHIMENMINAEYRIGTTGTLQDALVHKLAITGLFGPSKHVIKTHELIEQGYASKLLVKMLLLKHPKQVCKIRKTERWNYHKEVNYISQCEYRNKFIVNLAADLEGNTLILYNLVDKHGKILHKYLEESLPDNVKLHIIYGNISVSEREEIRHQINTDTDHKHILVASYGTTSTGVNMPNLHNCILAFGFKSKIRNLQSIGRILRKHVSKELATVFDLGDDLMHSTDTNRNSTYEHFMERMKLYAGERFPYKSYRINIGI